MCPSEYSSCVGNQAERDPQGRTCEEELTWAIETDPDHYAPGTPGMMEIFMCFERQYFMEICPAEASSCFDVPACGDAFHAMMAQSMAGTGEPPDMATMDPAMMSLMMCMGSSGDECSMCHDGCGFDDHSCHFSCDEGPCGFGSDCYEVCDATGCYMHCDEEGPPEW